jgi:hypothetical protein
LTAFFARFITFRAVRVARATAGAPFRRALAWAFAAAFVARPATALAFLIIAPARVLALEATAANVS